MPSSLEDIGGATKSSLGNAGSAKDLTPRSLLVAVLCIVLISLAVQQVNLVLDGPELLDLAPAAAPVFMLMILILLIMVLSRFRILSRGELVVVYCMVSIGSLLSGTGLVHRLLPGLVTVHYMYSDPGMAFHPFLKYIPAWFGPGDERSMAVNAFFIGSREGVPWKPWLLPLAMWSVLIFAMFFTMLCAVSLLRRQWVETENLNFPVARLPLELIDAEGRYRKIGGFLRQRLVWFGFSIPVLLLGYNGLTCYFPALSPVNLEIDLGTFLLEKPWSALGQRTNPFVFSVSLWMIGLSYLLPLEVSFSVWLFYLIGRFQLLASEIFGLTNVASISPHTYWAGDRLFPFLTSQARGGLYALVLFTLWTARSHIRDVLARVFRKRQSDEVNEAFSYRFSFWGMLGGGAVSVIWANMAGLSLWCSTAFFLLFLFFALAFARMRAEAGVPFVYGLPAIPLLIYIALGTGPHLFSASDYLIFPHLNMLCFSGFGMSMVILIESYKMGHVASVSPRRMTLALLVSFVIGLGVAYWTSLSTIYSHGVNELQSGEYVRGIAYYGRRVHHTTYRHTLTPFSWNWLDLTFEGIGFVFTAFLAVMRRTFSHWPLHPIGYIIGTRLGDALWSSVLLGWGIKALMLKYGGVRLYRLALPVFLGLAFGHLSMNALWAVVALVVGSAGG